MGKLDWQKYTGTFFAVKTAANKWALIRIETIESPGPSLNDPDFSQLSQADRVNSVRISWYLQTDGTTNFKGILAPVERQTEPRAYQTASVPVRTEYYRLNGQQVDRTSAHRTREVIVEKRFYSNGLGQMHRLICEVFR